MDDNFNEIINILINKFNPEKIILFGSRARGNSNENSDYDLLLLKKGIKNKIKETQEIYKNLLGLNLAVDILIETPEDYEINKLNKFTVYSNIDKEGKILYER
ncbi:MAG TPA: nucleotidyltransferase domain-containing protein [Spirochaetota bacterium]|nr:nucleotidyltransferase domain-containing protein [Spirochaetota bacterium]